jgi:pimeloyl-ACP methyl ester carboxylesterase
MPILDVDGHRVAYLEWAPPARAPTITTVLLLHALTGRASLWEPVAALLAPAGIHVTAMDLRGHGDSERSTDYGIETMAADAARLIEERGLAPADVLGHSIGGTVAWTLAAARPDLVRRLIIEDQRPAGDARHESYWKTWMDAWPWTLPSQDAGLAYLRAHRRSLPWWAPSLIPIGDGRWGWAFDREAVAAMVAGLHARSDWEVLGRLRAPTLIIRGAKSAHLKAGAAERMAAAIPTARTVTISDADHWVNRRAEPYAGAVIEFLTSASSRRS